MSGAQPSHSEQETMPVLSSFSEGVHRYELNVWDQRAADPKPDHGITEDKTIDCNF